MKIKNSLTLFFATIFLASLFLSTINSTQNVAAQYVSGNLQDKYAGQAEIPSGVTPNVTINTLPYMSISPNPIGTGQQILVNLWMQPALQMNRAFNTYTVTFTRPDGTTDVVGPLNSYTADATAWFTYTVNQVGNWQAKFDFGGEYFPPGIYYNGKVYSSLSAIGSYTVSTFGGPTYLDSAYYKPSSTSVMTFTVQNETVNSWPASQLPTDYWKRPVSPMNREWWSIVGDYPYTGYQYMPPANTNPYASNYKFTPYVQAPNSCHIVWARMGALASIEGGDNGQKTIGSGEGTYAGTPSIIFEGRCYQTVTKPMMQIVNGTYQSTPTSVWECYDLRTGQIYWDLTGITAAPTAITYSGGATAVPGASATQTGTTANLLAISSGRLLKYNPLTGAATLNISIPLSSATFYMDPYALSIQTIGSGSNASYRLINWTTAGTDNNFTTRIMSNITYPFGTLGTCDYQAGVAVSTLSYTSNSTGVATAVYMQAASLTSGKLLWNVSADVGYPIFSTATACADQGKFAVRFDNGYWYCWDLNSGKRLWQSEEESMPWGTFGAYSVASAYGLLYDFSYAGVYALDWNTGKIAWHFVAPCTPFESPWYPSMAFFGVAPQIADGKLYIANGEHSPTTPIARGWKLWCINATSGTGIWNISSRGNAGGISDGYLTFDSVYTGYMYVFGKGQTATTVSAPAMGVTAGNAITITGSVMDMSPGDQGSIINPVQPLDSTTKAGTVPCVSDDSMETQMEYLYMQYPIDGTYHNVTMTGVPVTLTAIGSDGQVITIGTTTTNPYYGTFGYTWTPPNAGTYAITASFDGSESYGNSSSATTVTIVNAQATATPSQQQIQTSQDNTPLMAATAAIIVALAVATAIIVLSVRKRQ